VSFLTSYFFSSLMMLGGYSNIEGLQVDLN
jgi:hypothetical protein